MKKIKIKILDDRPDRPSLYGRFIIGRLKQFYDVELSDDPDYVFYHDRDLGYLKYKKAIRIMYTGENIHPNLNLCDYSISFDLESYGGRNFRLPLYLVPWFYYDYMESVGEDPDFEKITKMSAEELAKKTGFCSFVYNNANADPRRKELFDAINAYKPVSAGGKYLNNIGFEVNGKVKHENAFKFSIAAENSSREGYVTEKLPGTLASRTIPIYFGDPGIERDFNTKRFINTLEYSDFAAVVERIKEIDNNDALYLEIVNQPILPEGHHHESVRQELDNFLRSIFDQPLAEGRRIKINPTHKHELEQKDAIYSVFVGMKNTMRPFITPFKKLFK